MPSRTILAKAYSILRGSRKKEDVPLDEFFHLCAPRIGIIPPDQYQQLMGWQISPPDDADQTKTLQVVRLFTPDLDALPNKFTTTNLSADDLVEYCVQAGCINIGNNDTPRSDAQDSLTMAVQPATANTMFATALFANDGRTASPSTPLTSICQKLCVVVSEPTTETSDHSTLNGASMAFTNAKPNQQDSFFNPVEEFDPSFNSAEEKNVEGSKKWNSCYPVSTTCVNEMLNIDWGQFVNDDGLS